MPHLLWLRSRFLFLSVCLRFCHTLFATQFATMLRHVDDAATCSRRLIELPTNTQTHGQAHPYKYAIRICVYFRHELVAEKFSY